MIPAALAAAFERAAPRPKFLYIVRTTRIRPATRWPRSGATDRRDLRALRRPILEDDPYGEIAFNGAPPPALLSHGAKGAVTYLGTGSKMVAPGLRSRGW